MIKEDANKAPKAVGEASIESDKAPLEIKFNAANSTDDGEIKAYRWNFEDGTTTGNENPSHTFEKAGSNDVELVVTDNQGLSDMTTVTITVAESLNEAPVAKASASPSSGFAPLNANFKGDKSNDDKSVDGYFWNFKDGSTSTLKNPSHTFSEPGTYDVVLSVKDSEGQTNETTVIVQVEQRPADNFENDNNVNGGGEVIPENNDSDNNDDDDTIVSENNGNYPVNAVFASSFGYNFSDATVALEAAIRSGSSYVVVDRQSTDWIIRPLSIFDLRNVTIVFESGVALRAKSGAFPKSNDQLFQLLRANNVTIKGYGATVKMNESEYSSGEHRHALALNKCINVIVKGLTLWDSGGDGILIAGIEAGSYSQNITIEYIISTNNRRLGVGIISAQNVFIKNSGFSDTGGTLPETGVYLKPNHASEHLVNINITNCKFSNNDSIGFFLSTDKSNSSPIPVSVKVFNSQFIYNSQSTKGNTPKSEIQVGQVITNNPVKGEIEFNGIRFNDSKYSVLFNRKSAESYKTVFKNCSAQDVEQNSTTVIGLDSLSTVNTLGGFVFDNFDIQFRSNATFLQIRAPSSGHTVKDITCDFSVRDPNENPLKYIGVTILAKILMYI